MILISNNYKFLDSLIIKPCHEIHQYGNLYIGSLRQICESIEDGKTYDVLVPLDHFPGDIWELMDPEKVIIDYYPIMDFSTLPLNHLKYLVNKIMKYLNNGKKTALFCLGGHGRTGYISACLLYEMGYKDPIKELHENYCKQAIECSSQVKSIIEYTGCKDLLKYYTEYLKIEAQFALYSKNPSKSK